jgi:hypothetical protein
MMRVLAITNDDGPLAELRVVSPLCELRRRGLIENYRVCDSALAGDAEYEFDTVLLQRISNVAVLRALRDAGIGYCLDIDDNLLARASYRRGLDGESIDSPFGLVEALQDCAALNCPTARLVRLLEKYSELTLADKAHVTPNALEFAGAIREPGPPTRLIWIQSEGAALSESFEPVVSAVEEFTRRKGVRVSWVGDVPKLAERLGSLDAMGRMPHPKLMELLREGRPGIGIAPLETLGDEETLDFVAGKSDVKMLLYGGMAHGGVYSQSAPYADSDLRAGPLVENTKDGWLRGLETEWEEGWRSARERAEEIRLRRDMSRIAEERWLPALTSVRRDRTTTLGALRNKLDRWYAVFSSEGETMMDRVEDRTEGKIRRLEERVKLLEARLERNTRAVDGIYSSKTWKALTHVFGMFGRLFGKKAG